jgi:LuxR family transcriptional regulator, maltose regulon positive regulatory protein
MLNQNRLILKTKLHRPLLPNMLVGRKALLDWLNQDLNHPLTLVIAPAGYGKTTLIDEWLNQLPSSMPSAWLSLDEADSDLYIFLRYFIAALRTIFKEACAESLDMLQAR